LLSAASEHSPPLGLLAAAPHKHDWGSGSHCSAEFYFVHVLQDFRRAGAEYASAIFIIAPKYPEDPTTADRYLSMCALSLGQYLQEVHVSMEERLSHTPKRVMHWIKHGTVRAPHLPPRLLFSCCGLTFPNALVLAF
jgi:hypothetical protein